MKRPLGIICNHLNPNELEMLHIIESYNLEFVIKRVLRKKAVPEHDIDRSVLEYRRYIGLKALGYDNMEMVDDNADEIWHAHIIFTYEYMEFCNSVCGRFIHHGPFSNRKPVGNVRRNFYLAYETLYGPYVG